jgi:hypothetical protein
MTRILRIAGAASLVLAPLATGLADQLRMASEPTDDTGQLGDYGTTEAAANLASIAEHQGLFLTAAYVCFAAALLTIPALVTIWRLSVARSPRWAWTGAVLAALGVLGQAVHLVAYYALNRVLAARGGGTEAAELLIALESDAFLLSLFVPFFFALICFIPQAIGLRRARVIPLWACLSIVAAMLLFIVTGSLPWVSAVWTALMVAGFTPAAMAALRPKPVVADVTSTPRVPTVAATGASSS